VHVCSAVDMAIRCAVMRSEMRNARGAAILRGRVIAALARSKYVQCRVVYSFCCNATRSTYTPACAVDVYEADSTDCEILHSIFVISFVRVMAFTVKAKPFSKAFCLCFGGSYAVKSYPHETSSNKNTMVIANWTEESSYK
jgi:hypothetical protein